MELQMVSLTASEFMKTKKKNNEMERVERKGKKKNGNISMLQGFEKYTFICCSNYLYEYVVSAG